MKKLLLSISLVLAIGFAGPTGCGILKKSPPPTAESISYNTLASANIGFKTALNAWTISYEKREHENEQTRKADPGGYLERQNALLREYGNVLGIQAKFTATQTEIVNAWLAAKKAGFPVPPEPVPNSAILDSITEVKTLTK